MTRSKLRHRRLHMHGMSAALSRQGATRHGGARPDAEQEATADDPLLSRARQQWMQGDWKGLVQIRLVDIGAHALRARLALLIAAGHQQLGHTEDARHCIVQALAWGCERRAVAQVLISGIHGTLARAAALTDDTARTQQHLQASLSMAYPEMDVQGLVSHRLAQLQQSPRLEQAVPAHSALDAGAPPPPISPQPSGGHSWPHALDQPMTDHPNALHPGDDPDDGGDAAESPGSATGPQGLPPGVATQMKRTTNLLRRLQQEVAQVRHDMDQGLRLVLQQQAQLIEAYVKISRAVDGKAELPSLQGWAVSADLAAHVMDLAAAGGYQAVIEFGSGSSTALVALALTQSRQPDARPLHLAFEHHPDYRSQTQALLERVAPGHRSQVHLAPLVPWQPRAGAATDFYACQAPLQALADSLGRSPRLLVLVDGPPAATGPLARYPALHAMLQHFAHASLDLLVDDYGRQDERTMVERWLAELAAQGRTATLEEFNFVKPACMIAVQAPA